MSFYVDEEIASQPQCWEQAIALAPQVADQLPRPGERVAFVGCGSSWFMAQSMANLREAADQGETDSFAASHVPGTRRYDRVVALTRSGTTTEVVELLQRLRGEVRTTVLTGDTDTPAAEAADDVVDLSFADEGAVVQTRFATSALALVRAWLDPASVAGIAEQAREALTEPLSEQQVDLEQVTFLGTGWTVGLAHEAALKFREASGGWAESYPAMEYRHGPISIAQPGRVVWCLGEAPSGLAEDVTATGATWRASVRDAQADLVVAQRLAVARAMAQGHNPDQPRNLQRSVVLVTD